MRSLSSQYETRQGARRNSTSRRFTACPSTFPDYRFFPAFFFVVPFFGVPFFRSHDGPNPLPFLARGFRLVLTAAFFAIESLLTADNFPMGTELLSYGGRQSTARDPFRQSI